jgi:hypothetical protein
MDQHAIKTGREFGHLAGTDVGPISTGVGTDPDVMFIRWSFFKTGFIPFLSGGQYIEILTQDDLSGMDEFDAVCQGRLVNSA